MSLTKTLPVTSPAPDAKEVVALRTAGTQLVRPILSMVEDLTVTTQEEYLTCDQNLGLIAQARRRWALKMSEILDPATESVRAAKRVLDATKALFNEYDTPLLQAEAKLKVAMREFKLAEQREQMRLEQEAASLRLKAEEQRLKEAQARTPQMTAKIAQKRSLLEQAAEEAEEHAGVRVMGTSSAARRVRKVRVLNVQLVAGGVSAGLIPQEALEVKVGYLEKLMREQPGIENTWPGVEAYDDIVIAKR